MVQESVLEEEERKLANWVIMRNEKSFSWTDEERGRFKEEFIPPYKIPTIEHTPWRDKPIPVPPAALQEVTEKIKDRIRTGVYEPSQGSYSSSIFVVKKKDGSYRFVHNMQTLNSITVRDNAVPPLLENFADEFAGLSCVGLFDLYDGYGQYPLHPDSRDLTTFQTALGPMRLTSIPQGGSNSVGVFQRAADFIANDESPPTCVAYLDDFGVKGPSTKYEDEDGEPERLITNPGVRRYIYEYLEALNRILWKMGKYGGTFSGKKVRLCDEVMTIVGFSCSYLGRKPTETSVKKISTWPPCRNVKEVRGFLGTVGPARNWIKNYAALARPLVRLTAGKISDKDFRWTKEADEAFDKVKRAIEECGWMRPINYTSLDMIYLAVDSSHIAVGWEIGQDHNGIRRPARFGSLTFNEREGRYSQAKLELYGVFKALKKCSQWIYGRKVRLEVDAKYLIEMVNSPELPNSAMTRWLWYIHNFDLQFVHVPANKHVVVDGLSRRRKSVDDSTEEDDEEWLDKICGATTHLSHGAICRRVYLLNELYDEDWRKLGRFLETQDLEGIDSKDQGKLKAKSLHYFVRDGRLFRRVRDGIPKEVIGTKSRQKEILREAHEEGGHKGSLALRHRVGLRFFWPGQAKDANDFVRTCDLCQRRDPRRFEEENRAVHPSDIGQVWGIDLVTMPPSRGYRYIIIAREDLSKWVEAKPIRKKEASVVAKFIMEHIVTRFGYFRRLKSDQGSEFMGEVVEMLKRYNLKHVRTSGYHPQANGMVERGNGPFKEALYRIASDTGKPWSDLISYACWAERTVHSRTTGCTPYRLMMGQECILPFDLEEATFLVRGQKDRCSTEDLLAHRLRQLLRRQVDLESAKERLSLAREIAVRDHNSRYDRRMHDPYEVGDWVLLRDSSQDVTYQTKEKPRWFGPYVIEERTEGRAYRIRELDGSIRTDLVGHNRLRPYYRREEIDRIQPMEEDESEGLFFDSEDNEEQGIDFDPDDMEWARTLDMPSEQDKGKLTERLWVPRRDIIRI
jgi:transposase InsO family protein